MSGYREKEGGRHSRYPTFTYMWEVRNSLDCAGQLTEFGIAGDRSERHEEAGGKDG